MLNFLIKFVLDSVLLVTPSYSVVLVLLILVKQDPLENQQACQRRFL